NADTTACQALDIGVLLDDTGSLTIDEREEIAQGIEGMIDNLIAIHAYTGNPYRIKIGTFNNSYEDLLPLTEVTSANKASIMAVLETNCTSGCWNYENL